MKLTDEERVFLTNLMNTAQFTGDVQSMRTTVAIITSIQEKIESDGGDTPQS